MQKILCVEDAPDTLLILKATLSDYLVSFAKTAQEAEVALSRENFSMVIMDVELPDGNGFEVLAKFAQELASSSVLLLTGKKDYASKATAFSLGADDFIQKPFDPMELKLRVDSRLSKLKRGQTVRHELKIGNLCINTIEQLVQGPHGNIDLTSLEFKILRLLASTPTKVFTREEIIERVWGPSHAITDRSVDVHISNLRRKVRDSQVHIDAIIGSGYRIQSSGN